MPEQLVDLSGMPIEKGDVLFIQDDENETVHVFMVENVEDRGELIRNVRVRVMKSTIFDINSFKNIIINAAVPTFGRIRKKADVKREDFEPLEMENLITNELRVYLDTQPNLQTTVKHAVNYLQTSGILQDDYESAKETMLIVARKRKDLFRSKGGWIRSLGVPYQTPQSYSLPGMYNTTKTVNITKVYMAMRLLLESGLFGDVRIENE